MTGAKKMDATKVEAGDLMAFTYYTKVKSVLANGEGVVVNDLDDNNKEIAIRGKELLENSFSADQFDEIRKVSKSVAAEKLVESRNRPLSVCFIKQDGEERTLRGRLINPEPLMGRSTVEDLDITGKNRIRLVDHRTLKWLIVEGVKFIVK